MRRLTILSSAIALAGGWQLAQAQPPGGGGGFAPPSFDSINMADEDGIKDDHLTEAEVMAWMQARMAGGGAGRGPGGPGPGAGGGPGGPGPGARGPGAGGPGGGPAGMFSRWDADGDGMVTREEFEARPRGGPGAGGPGGGPGGPPSQ